MQSYPQAATVAMEDGHGAMEDAELFAWGGMESVPPPPHQALSECHNDSSQKGESLAYSQVKIFNQFFFVVVLSWRENKSIIPS